MLDSSSPSAPQTERVLPRNDRPGLVAAIAYARGERVAEININDLAKWTKRPGHVVWVGLFEPDQDLLREVQAQLDLHPLAIEDASKPHQNPKIQQYGDVLFIVARTAQIVRGRIAFGETHIFVGKGYVVSVRHGASESYGAVRERCESCPATLSQGEDYILYAILDFIVDNYVPVLGEIKKEVEALEDSLFRSKIKGSSIDDLYIMRRDLLRLRNAITPLLDVCKRLEHADVRPIDAEMQHHFRDVTDHVERVKEEIDGQREVLAFAFEASLMRGQVAQTEITRSLAAWAAILAVPTAVAGIYGMNFKYMPELEWQYGYFVVVGGIVAACTTLYFCFRKYEWL